MKNRKPRKTRKSVGRHSGDQPQPRSSERSMIALGFGIGAMVFGLAAFLLIQSAFVFGSSLTERDNQILSRIPFLFAAVAIVSAVTTLLFTKRRESKVGRKFALVGAGLAAIAILVSYLSILLSWHRADSEVNEERAEEVVKMLVGVWQLESEDPKETYTAEFTLGRAVIVTRRYQDRDEPDKTFTSVEYGRFKIEDEMVYVQEDDDWHTRNDRWASKHTFEFLNEDRILFGPGSSSFYNFQGKWKRISKNATEPEPHEIESGF